MNITSETIAEVRSRANLLEVVSEFVVLKRAGKEHKGLCPFHTEKTPSFHVNPEKGIYKCFGCGEGGDVFAFMQKIKRLEFLDAVRELAQRYGVVLIETQAEKAEYDRRTNMLMLYQQASEYYLRLLNDAQQGEIARAYLASRGISQQTSEKFKLGYAPNVWDGLLRYLTTATKATPNTLEEAGLVRRKAGSNSYYDLFRNRLIIPICDSEGRVIAFGGRVLDDGEVKYLNSPETAIYTKGQHLFGMHLAKEAIKEKDSVIIVEGYFDVIASHQYGFTQTVAALGTALTEQQAKLLVRYTESKRVYLAFDADDAGRRAAERGVATLNQIAEGIGIELKALQIPGGKDPDECLRADNGPYVFAQAIASAPLLIDWQLAKAIEKIDLKTHTGRIDASKNIVPILAQIKNAVARGEYIRQWALRLGIREEDLLADVGQHRRLLGLGLSARTLPSSKAKNHSLKSGHLEAERQLLALYLTSTDDYQQVSSALVDESFIEPVHQRIKAALDGIGRQFNTIKDLQYKLMDRLAPDLEATNVMVDLIIKAEEFNKQKNSVDALLNEGRARVLKEKLQQAKNHLRTLMGLAKEENEQNAITCKINQLLRLESKLLVVAKTEDEFKGVKHKFEEILDDIGQLKQMETSV